MISARKTKHLDVKTTFTYSHANTPLSQSERSYYLSYFIKGDPIAHVLTSEHYYNDHTEPFSAIAEIQDNPSNRCKYHLPVALQKVGGKTGIVLF